MKTFKLQGNPREVSNKQATKVLRRNFDVPCILYGPGVENILFSVNAKELQQITHTPNSYIIELEIGGKNYLSVFHDAQYHPVTDEPLHADFLAISDNKPVAINVPVVITGSSEGVREGGKLILITRKVRIAAALQNLPDTITVDISGLKMGKTIVAGDLKSDNIQILTPKTTIICAVKLTRAAIGAAAVAATTTTK
ncbi:MAG: 50S ribosomal protein L25 [Rikenellaceae bacterium]